MENYTRRSLEGLWVGDCIGNLGQLYFAHDILKALEEGMAKFGGHLDKFQKQFQYSDDTEEAIVLYNHLTKNNKIIQDELAKEFATRYMERDPDGEIYGYGLSTRKVLRNIYEGTNWNEANKMVIIKEGVSSYVDKLVAGLSDGKGFHDTMKDVNEDIEKQKAKKEPVKEGSCGNGSTMRVAPLGAFLAESGYNIDINEIPDDRGLYFYEKKIIVEATLQAQVTHCHPEGIAGSIAITELAHDIAARVDDKDNGERYFINLLRCVPQGKVRDGIVKARDLRFDTPIPKAIEILGNGTHVTCQDTVPLCCWLTIKHLVQDKVEEMYEKAIIETSMAFGDVDTNCAIVGGMIGIISPAPEKWKKYCQPMEDVIDEEYKKEYPCPEMAERLQKMAGITL